MKILAIGDIHGHARLLEYASERMRESDLIIITGDLTKRGGNREAENILDIISRYNSCTLAVHGNWDDDEVQGLLIKRGISVHASSRTIAGTGFFGVGGAPVLPFKTPAQYTEEQIARFLEAGYPAVQNEKTTILISHAPPLGIRDRSFLGLRGGSTSVKRFIDSHRVDVCICGHIHEARGYEYRNNTLVVNTGTFKKGYCAFIEIGDRIQVTMERVKG